MKQIICVECGKEMTEQYLGQDWCEVCHIRFHLECQQNIINNIYCADCCGIQDCGKGGL